MSDEVNLLCKGGPSFEYTDQIWSNSQVLKTLTMKRDKKQIKNVGTDRKDILVSVSVLINIMI